MSWFAGPSLLRRPRRRRGHARGVRSEEHTSELQSRQYLVCRLLLEKKKERRVTRRDSVDKGVRRAGGWRAELSSTGGVDAVGVRRGPGRRKSAVLVPHKLLGCETL